MAQVKLMCVDVRKAHPISGCKEEKFFDGRVMRLKRWLHGMREAANSWEELRTEKLVEKGFRPVLFFNEETDVRVSVQEDDCF